ncbi:MAG: hypothetical protein J6W52_05675 [Bacteroidaceae bacterium]|nr:hypothetical protein [Bacteroidaceae bacterium]
MNYITFLFRKAVFAHLLVPLWKNRIQRRKMRNHVMAELCEAYVRDIPVVIPKDAVPERLPKEYIFSMWLQGEEQAPTVVKSCWDSIRRHCTEELVILDADNISNWIDLPEKIMEKWKSGKIKSSHISDLCRVELLWKYGGYWMDATDYMCHPMPEFIAQQPFFIYLGDEMGYSPFIQSCFIRAHAHHPIIGAWREIIRTYLTQHSRVFDYYLIHRLFRHIVLTDGKLSELFAQMPHISQSCTHTVRWRGYWEKPFNAQVFQQLSQEGAFQKLEYKSRSTRKPTKGTFADYIVNGRI